MARFDVVVRALDAVEPHPNADRLELAAIGGYRAVVGKGQFEAGELVAYIPEASVLPEDLIEQMGLHGKLAGPQHNRVHAVRLRGALSQGLVLKIKPHWSEGQSVMAELGITKFEPEIPEELKGAVYTLEREEGLTFDLENIKAFPKVFEEGEEVVFTEKIHGVFLAVGAHPTVGNPQHFEGRAWVGSKGLFAGRMAFDHTVDNPNVYVRSAITHNLYRVAMDLAVQYNQTVFVLGEAFGAGVQDLGYGGPSQFRVFSIVVNGEYVNDETLDLLIGKMGLQRAPVVYRGPFSHALLQAHTTGKESVSGQNLHVREGVVVTPIVERIDPQLGRVALKSVSEAYLLRKNGTEYS